MGKKLLGKETGKLIIQLLVIVLVPIIYFAVMHEQRHKTIAESYGCEAKIDYIPEPSKYFMHTSWKDCDKMTDTEKLALKMQQSNVETVGYQLIPVILLLIMNVIISHARYESEIKTQEVIADELK